MTRPWVVGEPGAPLRPVVVGCWCADRRHLGLHSGMIGDPCIDLVEAGALTGSRKVFDRDLHVGGDVLGSRHLLDWIDRNERVVVVPARYSHGPSVIGRIPDFVAINSAIEVALDGSVRAEVAGGRVISGPGGQPDFAVGASLSHGGVSILAFPTTAARGRQCRIVRSIDPSAPVTVPRHLADRVVTELGIARLTGLSIEERAEALRAIAHPDFRDQLG